MPWILDIGNVLIEIFGYPVSYLEAFSVLTALVSVWLAARNNIHTWTVGLVSVSAFFFLFYQAQLYSDALLQVFFFITSVLGIVWWKRPQKGLKKLKQHQLAFVWVMVISGAAALGMYMSFIHITLPRYFKLPAEYPFTDAFTTMASIIATILLIRRTLECWMLWISVDIVATIIYFQRGLYIVSIEYLIFLGMAIYGAYRWHKEYHNEQSTLGNIRSYSG